MERPLSPSTSAPDTASGQVALDEAGAWLDLAFQLSLLLFLAGLVWCVFGPDPQTTFTNRLQLAVLGFGFCLSSCLWITGATWPARLKVGLIFSSLALATWMGYQSARDFDASGRLMEKAVLEHGRVFHPALGLSYAMLPGYRIDSTPSIIHTLPQRGAATPKSATRLYNGDFAILCRLEKGVASRETAQIPSSIVLQALSNTTPHLSSVVRGVRQAEMQYASYPGVQIVRHTQRCRIAGVDAIEFEFVDHAKHLFGRQVYFQAGSFTVRFMLYTGDEEERELLDRLLNSIRLESPRP